MTMQKSFIKLQNRIARCKQCELWETRTQTVPMEVLSKNPAVLVVGEAPGETEDQKGIPFIGKSGELLRTTLQKAGLLNRCAITNILKCHPPFNARPTKFQIKACEPFFIEELGSLLGVNNIIILGRTAHRVLLPYTTDMNAGNFIVLSGTLYIYFHHPSWWLRNGGSKYADEQVLPVLENINWR